MGECKCKETPEPEVPTMAARGEMFEPLVAVYEESGGISVSPYALSPLEGACSSGVQLERIHRAPDGTVRVESGPVVETGPSCLPFVRICRDPNVFKTCLEEARKIGPIKDSKKLYELVRARMAKEDQEVFYVVLLNTQALVIAIGDPHRGERDRVGVGVPDVLRLPIVGGASAFMVVHNHPSGNVKPSKADDELTKAIAKAADAIGIQFLDHMVAGIDGYYSYSDNNLV